MAWVAWTLETFRTLRRPGRGKDQGLRAVRNWGCGFLDPGLGLAVSCASLLDPGVRQQLSDPRVRPPLRNPREYVRQVEHGRGLDQGARAEHRVQDRRVGFADA